MKFSCPYPLDVAEEDGGCPEAGSWDVEVAIDVDRESGEEILRVSDKATLCPECERPGVAEDTSRSVVIDADHHHAAHKKWLAKIAKAAAKGA